MGTPATSKHSSGRHLLVEWANGQDHWTRFIVGVVLSTRKPLSEEEVGDFYQCLLQEKELAPGPAPFIDQLEDLEDSASPEESLFLTKLADVENVNALAPKQEIEFNPALTLVFGENGAGKTGYVRVLKTVASVRNAEPILPNVLKPGGGKPSASISYRIGGTSDTIAWRGEQGLRPLNRIDVLDSRGLVQHVDDELTYVYTPGDLALFRIVHQAMESVRQRLDADREKRSPKTNPFTARFPRDSALYSKIEALGPSTNVKELEALAQVSTLEEQQIAPLRERVEALRGRGSADRLQLVRDEVALFRQVQLVLEAGDALPASEYSAAIRKRDEALAEHRRVSEESLGAASLPQVFGTAWRGMIDAAEQYIRETEHTHYPGTTDLCVYCRQPLAEAARHLIDKYRAFSNSSHHQEAMAAARTAQQLARPILDLDISRIASDLRRRHEQLADRAPPVFDVTLTYMRELGSLRDCLAQDALPPAPEALRTATDAARMPLRDHLQSAHEIERSLASELGDRERRLREELPKLRMLEARLVLRDLLPEITKHVEDSQWADKAGHVLRRFQGTFKSLTDASKSASEILLNQDFEARFRVECASLKAPAVTVDYPGRKGEPARRKSIAANHRLSTILSEGEQKVIALADFLAESSLRRAASPVVFDDPVTSLDYKRLAYVVSRIEELSRERQVVVFTHNIWFTMEVLACFEKVKERCTYYDVSQEGDLRGLVNRAHSPRLDSWGDKRGRINGLVQRIKAEKDMSMRQVLIEKAYEDLRGACEIVVEQDVLQRVVQSYSPNVMVGKLLDIKVAALPEAIKTVNEVFERCCRFIASHKQSIESLNVRPSIADLEKDWQAIQDVRESCRK